MDKREKYHRLLDTALADVRGSNHIGADTFAEVAKQYARFIQAADQLDFEARDIARLTEPRAVAIAKANYKNAARRLRDSMERLDDIGQAYEVLA